MILTPEQIAQLSLGIVDWNNVENAFHGNRIPGAMRPIYLEAEVSMIRMNCGSSIRLRFTSDTTRLRAAFSYGLRVHPKHRAALLVDGEPHSFPGPADGETPPAWEGVIFEQAQRKSRLFDLWLPPWSVTRVARLETDDDRPLVRPAPLPLRWLVYGDSITQGMNCGHAHLHYVARCARALDAEAMNMAIGGAILDPRLADTVPAGRFDLVSIAYGTNDIARGIPAATFVERLRALLAALDQAHPGVPVVVISNPPVPGRKEPDAHGQSISDYRAAVRAVHAPPRVFVVDGGDLLPNESRWFVDNVHPDDAGFELYANALLPVLRRALASRAIA